jgi:PhnB protein
VIDEGLEEIKMAQKVKAVPDGWNTITARLSVRGAGQAIEFYQQAFGASLIFMLKTPDGKVMHATMALGDSHFQLGEELQGMNTPSPQRLDGSPIVLHICVENIDELWNRAVASGAQVTMPLANQFWGARYGQVLDPFGFTWALFSHVEDVSPEELNRRADAFAKGMEKKAGA